MSGWDEEETVPPARSYSDAEAAADLARYQSLKRSVPVRSLAVAAIVGLVFIHWFALPSLALVVGSTCGVLNLLLTMRSGERVVDSRKVGAFVLSSFLRIAVFG